MNMWLIFVVLPALLIALSFRVRPIRGATGDIRGGRLFARGMFGVENQDLKPDERSIREETEARPFKLE